MKSKECPQFKGMIVEEAAHAIEKEMPGTVIHIGMIDGSSFVFCGDYKRYRKDMPGINRQKHQELETKTNKCVARREYMMHFMVLSTPGNWQDVSRRKGETADHFAGRIEEASKAWEKEFVKYWKLLCGDATEFKRGLSITGKTVGHAEVDILKKKLKALDNIRASISEALDCNKKAHDYSKYANEVIKLEEDVPKLRQRLKDWKDIQKREILEAYYRVQDDGIVLIVEGRESGGYWDKAEYDKANKENGGWA